MGKLSIKIVLGIICLLLFAILLSNFSILSSATVQTNDYTGLPDNFTPVVGFYHEFLGGRISLWDVNGNVYQSADGINFNYLTRESLAQQGLPIGFKPSVGYYHNLTNSNGQVVLWNSSGTVYETKSGKGNKWILMNASEKLGLPNGFKSVVARNSPLSGNQDGNLNIWGLNGNQYRINDVLSSWVKVNSSNVFPQNIPPLFSYHYNKDSVIIKGSNYRWYNVNNSLEVYKSIPPSGDGIPPVKIDATGLPSGIPTLGYADLIRNKVIIWYGKNVYESSDGINFVQVNIGNILCSSNTQCDDGDVATYDECVNPGNQNSYCRHTEINCLSNLECGFTGYFGTEFCSQNDVFKNYQLASCINPGTIQSYCSVDVSPNLIQDCNDGNSDTLDSCVEHTQSTPTYCSHEIFSCTQASQCGNVTSTLSCEGNDVHNVTHSPTCSQGECGEAVQDNFVQYCSYGCNLGACNSAPQQCTQNSQCGNVTSTLSCEGNDVHNVTQIPICNQNTCGSQTLDVFVQYCQYGCNLGICQNQTIIDECTSNSECNDSNSYTEDLCVVNNTSGNICSNPQIACLSNNDCSTSYSGNFCSNDDVYRSEINYTCVNPGTQNSICEQFSSQDIKVMECLNGCSNGVCKSSSGSGSGTSNRGGGGGRNIFDDLPFIIAPNGEILGQEKPIPQVIVIDDNQDDNLTTKRLPSSLNNSNSGLLWILLLFLFLLLLIILIIILSNIMKK